MSSPLNEDIVDEVLHHLWQLHAFGWDEEFRPEAFRRFFVTYACISRVWTIPALRYVYRYAHVGEIQRSSFELAMKNKQRGEALRNVIRVLDTSISNSKQFILLQHLDKLLRHCPYLVELRLHIGPQVNTLFTTKNQEARLRASFDTLRTTLRALQLKMEGPYTNTRVMAQLKQLIDFSKLDFITLAIQNIAESPPELGLKPEEWKMETDVDSYAHWPIESNSATVPLQAIQASSRTFIFPEILREYDSVLRTGDIPSPFLSLCGPYLKQVMGYCFSPKQYAYDRAGIYRGTLYPWEAGIDVVVSQCPSLERIIALLFSSGLKRRIDSTTSHMYILEKEDWHMTEVLESRDGDPIVADKRRLAVGEELTSFSHLVGFHKSVSYLNGRPEFRRGVIFDKRWPAEALSGLELTKVTVPDHPLSREAVEWLDNYSAQWMSDLLPYYDYYTIALRKSSKRH